MVDLLGLRGALDGDLDLAITSGVHGDESWDRRHSALDVHIRDIFRIGRVRCFVKEIELAIVSADGVKRPPESPDTISHLS